MNKIALITGSTSGIGKATAELFAARGINLIICGRRQKRLTELKNMLEEKVQVFTLSFDVRDKESVFEMIDSIPEDFQPINILLNNAGNNYGSVTIDNGEVSDWDNMIDINVKGLLYVTKAVLPQMIKNKNGHIVNIGSIASREVYPKGNVYCASKHAVYALNTGMRHDLLEHGIKVTAINPGVVNSEFSIVRFKGDSNKADSVYEGFKPLNAVDVAESILLAVTRPVHVNIADILILPTAQASVTHIKKD